MAKFTGIVTISSGNTKTGYLIAAVKHKYSTRHAEDRASIQCERQAVRMIDVTESDSLLDISMLTPAEKSIYLLKSQSPYTYTYASWAQLKFELSFREKIIEAARALLAAKVGFTVFAKARCNWKYWLRTPQGGFQLRPGALPSAAIRDIFVSGGL